MVYSFYILLNSVCQYLVKIFVCVVMRDIGRKELSSSGVSKWFQPVFNQTVSQTYFYFQLFPGHFPPLCLIGTSKSTGSKLNSFFFPEAFFRLSFLSQFMTLSHPVTQIKNEESSLTLYPLSHLHNSCQFQFLNLSQFLPDLSIPYTSILSYSSLFLTELLKQPSQQYTTSNLHFSNSFSTIISGTALFSNVATSYMQLLST